MFDQPIVERRSTSPLATSLLVLSAAFLLSATLIVGVQIKDQTYQTSKPTESAQAWAAKNQNNVIRDIEKILGPAEED